MCWTAATHKETKMKIAEKPFKVFKVSTGCKTNPNRAYAYYQGFAYVVGETYTILNDTHFRRPLYTHFDGFHSYTKDVKIIKYGDKLKAISPNRQEILDSFGDNNCNTVIMECTIPEGARYYQNSSGEVVSDKIKIDAIKDAPKY